MAIIGNNTEIVQSRFCNAQVAKTIGNRCTPQNIKELKDKRPFVKTKKITYNKDAWYPNAGKAILEYENQAAFDPIIILKGKKDTSVAMYNGMSFKKFFLIIDNIVYFNVKIILKE